MNERFVAIEVGSLYARGRERNMPGPGSPDIKPVVHPIRGEPRHIRIERPKKTEINLPPENNHGKDHKSEGLGEEPQQFQFNPDFRLDAQGGADIASVVSPIQDAADGEQVQISSEKINKLKTHLVEAGLKKSDVDSMANEQVIVGSQKLLIGSMPDFDKVVPSELEDITAVDKGESSVLRRKIEQAGNKNKDEEVLTEDKVEQTLKVVTEPIVEAPIKPVPSLERPIVTSEKPLWQLAREELTAELEVIGIDITIPEDWDKWKDGPKEDLLVESRVINEVEPVIDEKTIADRDYLIWQRDKTTKTVYGFGEDLSRQEVRSVLDSLGIKAKIPNDWEKHGVADRKYWLEERGVKAQIRYRVAEKDGPIVDSDLFELTRGQIKRTLGIKAPANWAAMGQIERRKVMLAHDIIPTMGGGAIEKPEWNDVPNPAFNPALPPRPGNFPNLNREASSMQDLTTLTSRRLQLINEGQAMVGPGHDWSELEGLIAARVAEITAPGFDDYKEVRLQFDALRGLRKTAESIPAAPGVPSATVRFNAALNPGLYAALEAKMDAINAVFAAQYIVTPEQIIKDYFKDIDDFTSDRLGSVIDTKWYTIDEVIGQIQQKAAQSPLNEFPELRGFRDWYIYERKLPQVEKVLETHRQLDRVTDPSRAERVVRRGLLKADGSALVGQDVSQHYQRISAIVADIPDDSEELRILKQMLYAEINASLTQNQLFLATGSEEGTPSKMLPIYSGIQNELATKGINTKQLLMRRFRMRYSNGEGIENDEGLQIINPATGQPYEFNILSDALNAYYWQLREERKMLNEIQAAQRERRALNANVFTSRGVGVPHASLTKLGINQWFERNTLMGASTKVIKRGGVLNPHTGVIEGGVEDPNEVTYFERQQRLMQKRIKRHLRRVRGVTQGQIDKMEFMVKAVNLNAYRWTRVDGGSEYDGIDLWRDEQGGTTKHAQDTIFSQRTPYFERAIDSTFKHYRAENRGRVAETNRTMEEEQPLGYMLPTVRVLVRLTENFFYNDTSPNAPRVLDAAGINTEWGLGLGANATVREAVDALAPIIMSRYGKNRKNAQGIAIAHLVDNGHIVFGRRVNNAADAHLLIDYEKEVEDETRFDRVDLMSDRATALQMFDRGVMQEYLRHPTFENLMKLYGEAFYSGRNVRLWDNMASAMRSHHKMEQQSKAWFRDKRKGSASDTYEAIEAAVQAGRLDPKDEEPLKRELLGVWLLPERIVIPFTNKTLLKIPERLRLHIPGVGPVRYARMYAEFLDAVGREWGKQIPASIMSAIMQFLQGIFKQSAEQLAGSSR